MSTPDGTDMAYTITLADALGRLGAAFPGAVVLDDDAGTPMATRQIADALDDVSYDTAKKTLQRMAADGQMATDRHGLYQPVPQCPRCPRALTSGEAGTHGTRDTGQRQRETDCRSIHKSLCRKSQN